MNRYPLRIQTFEEIRKNDWYYVDKTALVYSLVKGAQSCFLNRPRRFGKSLLVTTMQAYFEGKKELFKGLAIEMLEKDWVKYPVIHLDLSSGKYYDLNALKSTIGFLLYVYEKKYGISTIENDTFGTRLNNIIQAAAKQTGKNVVVLIDEYDVPVLDSNSKPELQARGCIDLLVSTKTTIFVMELKIDQSAEKALEQIDAKDYTLPFKHDGRRIFKVGVNFSTEKRTVDAWKYKEA